MEITGSIYHTGVLSRLASGRSGIYTQAYTRILLIKYYGIVFPHQISHFPLITQSKVRWENQLNLDCMCFPGLALSPSSKCHWFNQRLPVCHFVSHVQGWEEHEEEYCSQEANKGREEIYVYRGKAPISKHGWHALLDTMRAKNAAPCAGWDGGGAELHLEEGIWVLTMGRGARDCRRSKRTEGETITWPPELSQMIPFQYFLSVFLLEPQFPWFQSSACKKKHCLASLSKLSINDLGNFHWGSSFP